MCRGLSLYYRIQRTDFANYLRILYGVGYINMAEINVNEYFFDLFIYFINAFCNLCFGKEAVMKKLLSFISVLLFIIAASALCVLAAPSTSQPVDKFGITGGMDLRKGTETTFDSSRIISGTAQKDTVVDVIVYEVIEDADVTKLAELDRYTTTVGISEVFVQDVDLIVGKNLIVVKAFNGDKYSEISSVVKRKKSEIKNELRQGIVLPGQR